MTTTPRGGAPRSLGASLLDDVLAETLDPAYAQAAAARAAGQSPARPRWRGRAIVALTMAIAGLLVSVTYDQAAAGADGREEVREALVGDIDRESAISDELAVQLEDLSDEVTRTRDEVLAATEVGQDVLDELAGAERGSAAVRVTGPGVLVTLANADPTADDDPVGGTTEEDPRGRVRDGDLQLVVNALWAAGAEAVSINGQRLGPLTAIRFAGEAVLVDFKPVMNPYEISAIGDPDTMAGRFLLSPEVRSLGFISESFGLRFDYARKDELTLPAASTPELRIAVPEAPAGDAPATDPTPGG
ncbi:DUF881 domain-containing protein [Blastococcus sp. CT_GayMR16]|uniref:DUF881 domain-containing protein n=1 Tax=Blastococcus sp. CT_GayMR16 TaxID=2559607 RepID=UPI0010743D8D|nr:DUF881 domain-containing protein [Blastococcus sp. CT_GayMR16]TFV85824.1 DUF881 domain-containing protein [Blastococcus sp. CT_GayMR16]